MSFMTHRAPWFWPWRARAKPPVRAQANPSAVREGTDLASDAQAPSVDPALVERRAAALCQMFPKLYSWRASRSDGQHALEVHDYLAKAANVTDLENRIRMVEQRRRFGS